MVALLVGVFAILLQNTQSQYGAHAYLHCLCRHGEDGTSSVAHAQVVERRSWRPAKSLLLSLSSSSRGSASWAPQTNGDASVGAELQASGMSLHFAGVISQLGKSVAHIHSDST